MLGTSADYPPFEFYPMNDKEEVVVGIDIDIANEIANELGVTLDVKDVSKMLHLDEETVRRKLRNHELPDCIPGQKKLLWLKENIVAYLKFGQLFSAATADELQAISKALELGWPIDQMTLYGHDPGNLGVVGIHEKSVVLSISKQIKKTQIPFFHIPRFRFLAFEDGIAD